jgi:hypothetical protein
MAPINVSRLAVQRHPCIQQGAMQAEFGVVIDETMTQLRTNKLMRVVPSVVGTPLSMLR